MHQRFTQYIRQLSYTEHFQTKDDERPEDVLAPEKGDRREAGAWSATAFSSYVPFSVVRSG